MTQISGIPRSARAAQCVRKVPRPMGAMPLRVSDFHFPISVFHSLALTLAPICHGNTVVDKFPSPSSGPGTHRPRYLSAWYVPIGVSDFHFPSSVLQISNFHFQTSRHPQARRGPRGSYRLIIIFIKNYSLVYMII